MNAKNTLLIVLSVASSAVLAQASPYWTRIPAGPPPAAQSQAQPAAQRYDVRSPGNDARVRLRPNRPTWALAA